MRRLNAQGGEVRTYDAAGQDKWFALALDPDGTSFWAANSKTGLVYRFDIATGQVLASFDTGLRATFDDEAVGGLSIMPNLPAGQQASMPSVHDPIPPAQSIGEGSVSRRPMER